MGNNTNSITSSGWVADSSSHESSAGVPSSTYILPALELSDRSEIPVDLKDDLICPTTRELFNDPVLAINGHTYDRDAITIWLVKSKKSPLTNDALDNNILNSSTNIWRLLMNLAARTPQEFDTIKPQEVIKAKRNKRTSRTYFSKQNKTMQKLLMTLDPRMFHEDEIIKTQEVININIQTEIILKGHALWYESNDLSAGHASQQKSMYASWHDPNDLSHGQAS